MLLPSSTWTRRTCLSSLLTAMAWAPAERAAVARTPTLSAPRELQTLADVAHSGQLHSILLWPDPILRKNASPVTEFGPEVARVALMLTRTMESRAIAAIQYGVDAQMIVLKGQSSPEPGGRPLVLVNPTIVARSDERDMVPWREVCLVLPPGVEVDLLRDAWLSVQYQDVRGTSVTRTLRGEPARALQHEHDHLHGILIVDHAALEELPPAVQEVERPKHSERQRRAFERLGQS